MLLYIQTLTLHASVATLITSSSDLAARQPIGDMRITPPFGAMLHPPLKKGGAVRSEIYIFMNLGEKTVSKHLPPPIGYARS